MFRFKGGLQKVLQLTAHARCLNYKEHYVRLCSNSAFSTDNKQGDGSGGISGDSTKAQNPFANKFFNKSTRKPPSGSGQGEYSRPPRGSQPLNQGSGSSSSNYQPRSGNSQSSRYQNQSNKSSDSYSQSRGGASSGDFKNGKLSNVDQVFLTRFGKNKSELLDSWLEMDAADLIQECNRMGVAPSGKHIENIQNLFEQLKKIEAEIEAEGGISAGSNHQQPQKSQSPENLFRKPSRIDKAPASSTTQGSGQSHSVFGQQQSSPRSFMVDQEKARENLNEQLARILNKRKTTKAPSLFNDSQNHDQQIQDVKEAKYFKDSASEDLASQPKEQTLTIENPFHFSLSGLKKQVMERGPILSEASASATFSYTHTDSALIDRIFEMSPDQLDSHFKTYAAVPASADKKTQKNHLFEQMDLKADDFEKMPSITKKKVLINMTGLRQTILSDPNLAVLESRHNSLKSIVQFAHENLLFLNDKSKSLLGDQLQSLVKASDSNQRGQMSVLFNNPGLQLELIKVSQHLFDKKGQEALKNQLLKVSQSELENVQDLSLDNALLYSKVLGYLSKESVEEHANTIHKLQSLFQNAIKKAVNRKTLKNLSFQQQLQLLDVLPNPQETEPSAIQKSLQYQLLNEMVSPSNNLISKWESLDKEQVLRIVSRCMELSKARDINNKLRGCLTYISTQQFSLSDFHNLFKMLSESHGYTSQTGQVDVKLISGLLMRRNLKTAANLLNSSDPVELKKHFDFYEFLYKQNPVAFAFFPHEIKMLITRAQHLAQEQHLPLQEMVAFSKTMVPSLYKPVMFFAEMITNKRESFKTDVNHDDLYELVAQVLKRAQDGEVDFEHLQLSTSRVHRNYRPYTEKTVILLRRILDDIIGDGNQTINDKELSIVSKILCEPKLTEFLYKTSPEMETQIKPILSSMFKSLQLKQQIFQNSKHSNDPTQEQSYQENLAIDFNQWIEHFQALSSVSLLLDARNSTPLPQQSELASLKETLLNEVAPLSFTVLKQELYRAQSLAGSDTSTESPLDKIFKLNKSLLTFFDNAGFQEQLYQDSQVRELVTAVLEQYFLNKKPFLLSFEKFKKNIKISKMIQVETNKALISNNVKEIVHFLNYAQNLEGAKEIAREMCKLMLPISRSIVGNDLVNMFKMIDRYGITEDVRQLMINVAPNLMTIELQKIYLNKEGKSDIHFGRVNERLEKSDLTNKIMILKKYESIYHHQPELLKRPEASLSPLSYLMAEVFDEYQDDQVLMCLEILGSDKVDNYHEEFIKRLFERYNQPSVIDNMANANQRFFLKFAKHWPHFLKNNALLNQLISLGRQSSTLVKQQSETLHILTRKNVLHPELLEAHLETFMKMKDRERVAEYLKEFLHSCAVLGYTELKPPEVHKITQLFRRLYKTPEQVPEISQLLDYFIVLALSNNVYFKDFDEKSVEFVEAGIALIEKRFTGSECLEVPLTDPITAEKIVNSETGKQENIRLSYFQSIPSQSKIYNKVLVPNTQFTKKLNFSKAERDLQAMANMEETILSSEDEEEKVLMVEKKEEVDAESATIKQVVTQFKKEEKKDKYKIKNLNDEDETQTFTENEFLAEEAAAEGAIDFVINDDIDAGLHSAVKKQHANEKAGEGGIPIEQKNVKEKKIYERKASESLYSEELEFHQFRKKKLQDLDKKSKHLLLFSNINQLNFVDVNQNEIVKAWAVLFHFRSKTFDSIIYDEFESITMRNAIGKSKGHELFSKFYLKLIEASYDKGFRMHLTTKCEKTGWPIDISLNTAGQSPMDTNTSFNSAASQQRRKLALYFFLQEEVCLNAREQAEEPLGLQKLMLKHLQNISDFKVEYVTENDFYMNKDTIEDFVDYLLSEKLLNNSKSQTSSY